MYPRFYQCLIKMGLRLIRSGLVFLLYPNWNSSGIHQDLMFLNLTYTLPRSYLIIIYSVGHAKILYGFFK